MKVNFNLHFVNLNHSVRHTLTHTFAFVYIYKHTHYIQMYTHTNELRFTFSDKIRDFLFY